MLNLIKHIMKMRLLGARELGFKVNDGSQVKAMQLICSLDSGE